MNKIEPRLLKGFRDFYGKELRTRQSVINTIKEVFEKYGFEPLETPVLEYFETLMGKYGEEEKLVYQFEDHGERRVAMKYDLTVPTARFIAQNFGKLTFPLKRYQIQPVWRADNTQKGRFREFYQCDADFFGVKDMVAEAEFISMSIEILQKLGFEDFKIRINNRKILNAIAEYAGRKDKFFEIVYAIDKWDKRTEEQTIADLISRGLNDIETTKVIECIVDETGEYKNLERLEAIMQSVPEGIEGINELREILDLVESDKLVYDPTIARGLAYYTGPVWEMTILEGGVGSVGGAGRYDKLIGTMLGQDLPATGGSFGLERIIEVMKDRNMFDTDVENIDVMVTIFDQSMVKVSYKIAALFRESGFKTLLYPDAKKLSKQFDYANKINARFAIVIGEEEMKNNKVSLKNMATGEQKIVNIEEAISLIKK